MLSAMWLVRTCTLKTLVPHNLRVSPTGALQKKIY